MGLFEGKVVLVAGAGRGVGRAAASALHREGAELVLVDSGVNEDGSSPDPSVVAHVAREIQSDGGDPLFFDADCCDPAQIAEVMEHTVDHYGKVDAALWSVGLARAGQLSGATNERIAQSVTGQLEGAFEFMRLMSDAFGSRGGRMVFLAGQDAFFASARRTMAAALDGAIVGLVRSAAVELARREIMVNAVIPTARTRLTADLPLFQSVAEGSMTAAQVCPVILFLLSELARDTTGEVVGSAGGRAYGFRTQETPGVFAGEGSFTIEEVAAQWGELIRGA